MDPLERSLAAFWYLSNGYSNQATGERLKSRFAGITDDQIEMALRGGLDLTGSGSRVSSSSRSGDNFSTLDLPRYGTGDTVEAKIRYKWASDKESGWSTISGSFSLNENFDDITNLATVDNQAQSKGSRGQADRYRPEGVVVTEIFVEYAYVR